jgi:hypothetical protein
MIAETQHDSKEHVTNAKNHRYLLLERISESDFIFTHLPHLNTQIDITIKIII